MMIKCKKCGAEIPEDTKFCLACGERVNEEQNVLRGHEQHLHSTQTSFVGDPDFEHSAQKSAQASNEMAVAGFCLSFFVPILGFIFGILGITKSKEQGRKTLAIFAVAISCVVFIFNMLIQIFSAQIMQFIIEQFPELEQYFNEVANLLFR